MSMASPVMPLASPGQAAHLISRGRALHLRFRLRQSAWFGSSVDTSVWKEATVGFSQGPGQSSSGFVGGAADMSDFDANNIEGCCRASAVRAEARAVNGIVLRGAKNPNPKRNGHGGRDDLGGNGEHDNASLNLDPAGRGLRRGNDPPFNPHVMVLPLPRRPLFPNQQQFVSISNSNVVQELLRILKKGMPPLVGAFLRKSDEKTTNQSEGGDEEASHEDHVNGQDVGETVHNVGTLAQIMRISTVDSSGLQLVLLGCDIIRLEKVLEAGPPMKALVSKMRYVGAVDAGNGARYTVRALINETLHVIREIMNINPQFQEHAALLHQSMDRLERDDPHGMAHFAASLTTASGTDLLKVLEADDPSAKLHAALVLLKKELQLVLLQKKIAAQIDEKVSGQQREHVLREQLKRIRNELGEGKGDGVDTLLHKFKARLNGKAVPAEIQQAIDAEMDKFAGLARESQEYQMTRSYLDWLTMIPWGVFSKDTLSLSKARHVLDRDHYGLTDVKERIIELIAVSRLRGSVQGKIMCFVGPPGVGKSSIGRSIAEALGREFYRFSVGGLSDVAEIKGHRRTYVGSMPGKMIQCLRKAQTANPVVLIDEVDKIGYGIHGDPSSALLELLDPSQNDSFLDHYLDVPVDCSKVLFVCTANITDTIQGPLLDRMEVIRLSGYDFNEKVQIAQNYLVPAAMREVGLWQPHSSLPATAEERNTTGADAERAGTASIAETSATSHSAVAAVASTANAALAASGAEARISLSAVEALIRWYCREAGVRNLQKHIEKVCRKLAKKLVERQELSEQALLAPATERGEEVVLQLCVTEDQLNDYVGKPPFISDRLYQSNLPSGTVTGLAWTSMGGSVLYVESTALPRTDVSKFGSPTLNVTGQLGNVMKESTQLALCVARRYLAAHSAELGTRASFFETNDIFLHCPEGATPKDGPSAGVTIVSSLLSLALNQSVRADLAMTGEVTLNGKVLVVGGIKEKTIAAKRAGCHALLFPEENRRDYDELPQYIRDGLEVHFASEYDDVFKIAFQSADSSPKVGKVE
eukprot:TRINITY_DN7869_c0_g2_i1.p1 TRINITY_DN7869_c0_g2~~TRINITY_DN7869_c0_g2_i1.p1  ORF type:complete len:1043 (-),score=224.54 TRINITY_DN7869_c0_g2_i1:387-3515(-)